MSNEIESWERLGNGWGVSSQMSDRLGKLAEVRGFRKGRLHSRRRALTLPGLGAATDEPTNAVPLPLPLETSQELVLAVSRAMGREGLNYANLCPETEEKSRPIRLTRRKKPVAADGFLECELAFFAEGEALAEGQKE